MLNLNEDNELKLKRIYLLLGSGFISKTPEIEKLITELESKTDDIFNSVEINLNNSTSVFNVSKTCNNLYCDGNCKICKG